MKIKQLLSLAFNQGASDIHLACGQPFCWRVNGILQMNRENMMNRQQICDFLNLFIDKVQLEDDYLSCELDFVYALDDMRCRINCYTDCCGPAVAIRPIPHRVPSLSELNLSPMLATLCERESHGLILVVGPTGSGKTTTLAAMIHEINRTKCQHILTIEDPIEFRHQSIRCLVNQRQIGVHTNNCHTALRAALREDPDVILIGEVRDVETIRLALTAAETGHLVLTTLHAYSATQAINRVIDIFPATEKAMIRTLLSHSLRSIIAQQLIKKANGDGRVALQEIMIATPPIQHMIRENNIAQMQSVMQTSQKDGMITIVQAMKSLKDHGII